MAAHAADSIVSLHDQCLQSFSELLSSSNSHNTELQMFFGSLQKQFARFQIWAESAGAHRRNRVSLDYRLREASKIKGMVLKLLRELDSDLQDAIDIMSDGASSDDGSSNASSQSSQKGSAEATEEDVLEEEQPPAAEPMETNPDYDELNECLVDITDVITCLYEFSIAIQNPAPRDRLQKCSSIDVSHFVFYDIQHITNKFWNAAEYLQERLGKANVRRRQLLQYYERHHKNITGQHGKDQDHENAQQQETQQIAPKPDNGREVKEEKDEEEGPAAQNENQGGPTLASVPSCAGTVITMRTTTTITIVSPTQYHNFDVDGGSDTNQTQTSYSSSVGGGGYLLLVPPLPEAGQDRTPFQCPICFTMISVRSYHSWKRHVFQDLRPYVCTFKGCAKSEYLFDSQLDWFEHESELHRRSWHCNRCNETYDIKTGFEEHLQKKHSGSYTEQYLQTVIERCERPRVSEQPCPLCGEMQPFSRLRRHLGHHMQQAALFVLRLPEEAETGGSESGEAQDDSDEDSRGLGESNLDFGSSPSQESAGPTAQGPTPETEDGTTDAVAKTNSMATIWFTDATGREYAFPFELCRTWMDMKEMIVSHVVNPDQRLMDEQYDLHRSDGQMISPQDWQTFIEPGLLITMRMWPLPEYIPPPQESEPIPTPPAPASAAEPAQETEHIETPDPDGTEQKLSAPRSINSTPESQTDGQFEHIQDEQALEWLKATNPDALYDVNRSHRLPGTCDWILIKENYQKWVTAVGPQNLWVVGIPGAGKSVLCTSLVEGLRALKGVVVLYFFFRNGDTSTTVPLEMAASIIFQLINSAGATDRIKLLRILKQVVHHGAPFADRGRNFKNVWKAFGDMLQSYSGSSRVIVVLDALDECGHPPSISDGVLQLQSSARFLVTGRPIVRELFEDKPNVSTIEMDVGEDISKFIAEQVTEIKGLDRHKDAIIHTVNENSAGMFRYAALVLEELKKPSRSRISERLKTIPKGVVGMYEWMILRLGPRQDQEEIQMFGPNEEGEHDDEVFYMRKRVLLWVALAFEPVRICEMQYACATVSMDRDFSFDLDDISFPSEEQILKSCGSLVEIFDGDKLRFTHPTIKEFLLLPPSALSQPDDERVASLLVDPKIAHATIALTCVTPFLSIRCPSSDALSYAGRHWYFHAAEVPFEEMTPEDLWMTLRFFFWDVQVDASHSLDKELHTSAAFHRWLDTCNNEPEYGGDLRGYQPLHIAAEFGLVDILKFACAHPEGLDFNHGSASGATPLLLAAFRGRTAAAETLLQLGHGVDINLVDQGSKTPLIRALQGAHEEVAQLILREDGVDVDHVDKDGNSALDYAFKADLHGTVELLKVKGATVCRDSIRSAIFPDGSS